MTLVSDQASNRDAIPSPQCALGTTPHLSIQKTARDEGEERRKGDRGREETRPGKDSRGCEGWWERKGREKQRDNSTFYTTGREKRHNFHRHHQRGDSQEMKVNQERQQHDAELKAAKQLWTQHGQINNQTCLKLGRKVTPLALITVTRRVWEDRRREERTGGGMEVARMSCGCFAKRLRAGRHELWPTACRQHTPHTR